MFCGCFSHILYTMFTIFIFIIFLSVPVLAAAPDNLHASYNVPYRPFYHFPIFYYFCFLKVKYSYPTILLQNSLTTHNLYPNTTALFSGVYIYLYVFLHTLLPHIFIFFFSHFYIFLPVLAAAPDISNIYFSIKTCFSNILTPPFFYLLLHFLTYYIFIKRLYSYSNHINPVPSYSYHLPPK